MNEDDKNIIEEEADDIPSIDLNLKSRKSVRISDSTFRVLQYGSVLKTWKEISKVNYLSALSLQTGSKEQHIFSSNFLPKTLISLAFDILDKKRRDSFTSENFPIIITPLLNEDQLWGCFYNFSELYDDSYSPVVKIRNIEDVPPLEEGILTRDMVTACLSYLKRTPILGDFVYIKLNLSSKKLVNIEVLQHYKYLVYVDLSCNFLSDLTVLSNLPYLQYLSVDYNRLKSVLDYSPAQWFLTEVHFKYNNVMNIQDLTEFWSMTVLDLSHNNIKHISGLQNLRYLRRLDLSFNHIQRLENLSHLRLVWLDISNNNISSFEFGHDVGLWTLLHLEYLNLNENNLSSLKLFSGCTRLKELHVRNNQLSILLELAVYMRTMRRLGLIDLRSNPICNVPGYKDVVINTFPVLLNLDNEDLDPIEQRTLKMNMTPDIQTFASRRLSRLLYIEQLSRARVSMYTPPADSTDVPIVILVGYEAVGKGTLARRLATECSSNVELALQHTTAFYHQIDNYIVVSRKNFDEMLLDGEFLTYSEMDGESYGLTREQAFVKNGKVKIVTMDLIGALMLQLRGYRPYLILTFCHDKRSLALRQQERKIIRNAAYEKRLSMDPPTELSTLQVLLSGRIIIKGLLNEIVQNFLEYSESSEFLLESQCSLLDVELRRKHKDEKKSSTSLPREEVNKSPADSSLFSLYNQPQGMDEYVSDVYGQVLFHEKLSKRSIDTRSLPAKDPGSTHGRHHASSAWKVGSRKSSKSVTFTSGVAYEERQELHNVETDPSGMLVETPREADEESVLMKSISAKVLRPRPENSDLWLAFLVENKLLQTSDTESHVSEPLRRETKVDDQQFLIKQLENYKELPSETFTTNIRDDYEEIHHNCPGLFWDTVSMDNQNEAFKKLKNIIKNIVHSQKDLKPMFDIDFANMDHPIIKKKLASICSEIAPQRLFY
ncbi:uncharacterized protein LOC116771232 isoform X2 [Danaus plexippus]|uniref:uncharacterized protein LOC116771232 isoform X2 n=1 Tax=Danaus plexippus TaxID=13037 RepID=UPI002AB2CCF4|nr:uncharacterized protein LOC116771232 isoform X2 [Danaus plexippus]